MIGYFLKKGIILSVRSKNLVTRNLNTLLALEILPQSKLILLISCSSLTCWISWNSSCTFTFSLWVADFLILTKKQPSADENPANHWGSFITWSKTKGLWTGCISAKASDSWSERPLFIEAFKLIIALRPSWVKCCFFSFICTTFFQRIKSASFWPRPSFATLCGTQARGQSAEGRTSLLKDNYRNGL